VTNVKFSNASPPTQHPVQEKEAYLDKSVVQSDRSKELDTVLLGGLGES